MRDTGNTRPARAPGGRRPALGADDVAAIMALRAFVAGADRSDPAREATYRTALAGHEAALPPAARAWWSGQASDDVSAELARWRPAYRIERTRSGYRAFRWVARRRAYASRPTAAGLDAAGLAPYRTMTRR